MTGNMDIGKDLPSAALEALVAWGIVAAPQVVPHVPIDGARPNNCTINARAAADRIDGQVVTGWRIAVWRGIIFEAIGHAVVETPGGLLCITPPASTSNSIIFVPDARVTEDQYGRMPSRRVAIVEDDLVQQFVAGQAEARAIASRYPVGTPNSARSPEDQARVVVVMSDLAALQRAVLEKYPT